MQDYAQQFLGRKVTVRIDRSLGSKHPKHDFYYPVNYGCIPGTLAPDGEEVDAYVLGVFEPKAEFSGKCIAIIHRLDDDDDKVIVAPEGKEYSKEQIAALVEFQERFFKSIIIK